MRKRIFIIPCVAIALLVLFMAYHIGLLHRAAFTVARAAGIEWRESAPQTIHVYFPRWACGEGMPPYLLVGTDDTATVPEIGNHIRFGNDDAVNFGEHFFAVCRGRFRNSLAMLIWEHGILRIEGWGSDEISVTGRFFQADFCEPQEPSLEQYLRIDELMKPHKEPAQ